MFLKVDVNTWSKVEGIDLHSKLVAQFLVTNSYANVIGFYRIPLSAVAKSLSMTENKVKESLEKLKASRYCIYDPVSEFVWIIDMFGTQASDIKNANDNRFKYVKKQIESIVQLSPPTFFNVFLEYYEDKLGQEFISSVNEKMNSKNTVLDKLLGLSEPSESKSTDKTLDLFEGNQTLKETAQSKKEKRQAILDKKFEEFWKVFPRRDGKKDAKKAFDSMTIDISEIDKVIEGAKKYAFQCTQRQTEERFMKTPGPWIRAEKWDDESLNESVRQTSSCMTRDAMNTDDYASQATAQGFDFVNQDNNDTANNDTKKLASRSASTTKSFLKSITGS